MENISPKIFRKLLDKMADEGKITRFIDEKGVKRFCHPNGLDGIIMCPFCDYPIELKIEFQCRNCNHKFKRV